MSSSFCEYRPGHYHAAIDIKTWKQEGFPCYAIADGRVLRIRLSPFGYGKVIYLQLDDGNIAVYAHLKSFTPELDKLIRKKQIANKRYTLNWRPKYWPVKKGEIIAYTGQTGIGVPHLHFEVRDSRHQPINPLLFYKDTIKDNRAPVLKSILVIPQSAESRVEGEFEDQIIPLVYQRDNRYVLEHPVRASGTIGLAISGYDMADEVYNKYAFYKTKLYIAGKPVFQIVYDTLNYDVTSQIDVETVYSRWINDSDVYHKLYIDPYNTLPFYKRNLGNGLISVKESKIPFRIEVSDYFGNSREVIGEIHPYHRQPATLQVLKRDTTSTLIKLGLPLHLESLRFRRSEDGVLWNNIDYFEVIGHHKYNPMQLLFIRLNEPILPESYLETTVETSLDKGLVTTLFVTDSLPYPPEVQIKNLGKYLRFRFSDILDVDGLTLTVAGLTTSPAAHNGQFEYVLPASRIDSTCFDLSLESARHFMLDTTLNVKRLLPGLAGSHGFMNDRLVLSTRSGSLYDTMLVTFNSTDKPVTDDEAVILSDIFAFSPTDQKFKNDITLSFQYDSLSYNGEQTGIYSLNGNGHLSYTGSVNDTLHRRHSFRTERLGRYIIAADTTRPFLDIRVPQAGARYQNSPTIEFYANDKLSGIHDEQAFSVLLDGRFVLPEWDPEEERIIARPHFAVETGRHELIVRVTDAAGNYTEEKVTFTIY